MKPRLYYPAELCGFVDQAAIEAHLFDAFIPAAYRAPAKGHWTATQAQMWLTFLARHLERTIGSPNTRLVAAPASHAKP